MPGEDEQITCEAIYFQLRRAAAIQAKLTARINTIFERFPSLLTEPRTEPGTRGWRHQQRRRWELLLSNFSLTYFGACDTVMRLGFLRCNVINDDEFQMNERNFRYPVNLLGRSRLSGLCRIALERWPIREDTEGEVDFVTENTRPNATIWEDALYMRRHWADFNCVRDEWEPRVDDGRDRRGEGFA